MALPTFQLENTNRSAREVARQFAPQADMTPPYQRGSVWTSDQKQALIKSWVMGIPVGSMILNDRARWRDAAGKSYLESSPTIWAVVDGKQRMQTACDWFAGELKVPAAWFPEDEVQDPNVTMVSYDQLSLSTQRRQGRSFLLPVIETLLPTVQAEAELYLLVNGGGTGQTAEDMQRASTIAEA